MSRAIPLTARGGFRQWTSMMVTSLSVVALAGCSSPESEASHQVDIYSRDFPEAQWKGACQSAGSDSAVDYYCWLGWAPRQGNLSARTTFEWQARFQAHDDGSGFGGTSVEPSPGRVTTSGTMVGVGVRCARLDFNDHSYPKFDFQMGTSTSEGPAGANSAASVDGQVRSFEKYHCRLISGSSGLPAGGGSANTPAVGRARVTDLATGADHSCVVAGGVVRCWGGNETGQLGNGTTADVLDEPGEVPTRVALGGPALKVAAGAFFSCALLRSGTVRCWGAGEQGQLGNGARTSLMERSGEVPSRVPIGEPAVAIAAGSHHACAIVRSGAVRCWGDGAGGQLGSGSKRNLLDTPGGRPSRVPLGGRAVALAAGDLHTCALMDGGAVRCWGSGRFGVLGSGASVNLMDQPGEAASLVPLGGPAVAITAGVGHNCALMRSRAIRCWGRGGYGQLDGRNDVNRLDRPREKPTRVPLGPAVAVAAGDFMTCAIQVAGRVRCWGSREFGGLANGDADRYTNFRGEIPTTVPLDAPATRITGSLGGGCALLTNGKVRCWGSGLAGSLGTGGTDDLMDNPGEVPSTVPLG